MDWRKPFQLFVVALALSPTLVAVAGPADAPPAPPFQCPASTSGSGCRQGDDVGPWGVDGGQGVKGPRLVHPLDVGVAPERQQRR